jgi:DNA-directed RNA polymerase specialized sigma24 family protein
MWTTRTGPAGPDPAGPDPAGPDPAEAVAAEAVAALYQLHYPSLVRLAALLVPDPATAEDIVQEAFAALHGEWPMLPGTEAALARLRRSVVRRSRSASSLRPAAGTGVPGSAVMSALRTLPVRQREVVVLRYFADLPEGEIAAATGLSAAAVRHHAVRAMSSLQAGLGPAGSGQGAATSGR